MPYRPAVGVCISTLLFICGVTGFPVLPEEPPLATGMLSIGGIGPDVEAAPGDHLRVVGDGFMPQAAVTLGIYSEPQQLATTTADAGGAVDTIVTIPEDLVGDHTVIAIGNGPDGVPVVLRAGVTVVQDAGVLPVTGFRVGALALGGLGMIVAGFALLRTTFGRRPFLPTHS